VREHKLTHMEIARRSGTSRTRVTAILNDDLEHVSTDLLIRILAALGYRRSTRSGRQPMQARLSVVIPYDGSGFSHYPSSQTQVIPEAE
jgi:transcriptional regulator with XRE-family HTH domain